MEYPQQTGAGALYLRILIMMAIRILFISSGIVKRPLDLDFIMFFSNIKDPRIFGSPENIQKALLEKMPDGASHPFLFKGDGNLGFKDVSENGEPVK